MKNNFKKIIAPVIITVLLIVYFVVYFSILITVLNGFWKYLLVVIPAAMIAVTIYVCVERIKEIRSGEEDDLGKY